jgi:anaerobic selenocysteine-containing dehydrogenase
VAAGAAGTDAVLAMGLLGVIVAEKLYDEAFVAGWCNGFERLAELTARFSPSYVADVTGVPAEKVVEAARLFAGNSPATLFSGRGIDQIGPNSFQTQRALASIRAITGNLDVPGASHITEMPDFIPEIDLEMSDRLPAAARAKQLGNLRLQPYAGYDRIREETLRHGKRCRCAIDIGPAQSGEACDSDRPSYPNRSLIVKATNPLLTHADSPLVSRRSRATISCGLELFPTPTGEVADYLLRAPGR